ncbi:unnamed protein product [Moneuplotes crassus]|uniref:leucine--tRNA ligase n=1 Tax=Euplotes crassus TaxID=5936 RepID=A0AAD1U2D4_EUPCR|nr:unnamed protein product [Moneuplotes crassus]
MKPAQRFGSSLNHPRFYFSTKDFAKQRDFLRGIEASVQKKWDDLGINDVDAPKDYSHLSFEEKNNGKFYNTFPFPYTNGRLHLGHAYSSSKNEFATRFERLKGKRSLFPFAFHCTGTPIAAAAKRLVREKEMSGNSKISGKSQKEILKSMGIKEDQIVKFEDPEHWLDYFVPKGKEDMQILGLNIDWRRAFITTSKNPYYDSFIRWQYNLLKRKNKIVFDKRPAIYSIVDDQPCADHDRSEGEGVFPKEFTGIKLKVSHSSENLKKYGEEDIYFVTVTENYELFQEASACYVSPDAEYGVYKMPGNQFYITSERAMLHLAYQGYTEEFGKYEKVGSIKGSSLVGTSLINSSSKHRVLKTLASSEIDMSRGTGITFDVELDEQASYSSHQNEGDSHQKFRGTIGTMKNLGFTWTNPLPQFQYSTSQKELSQAALDEVIEGSWESCKDKEYYKERMAHGCFSSGPFLSHSEASKNHQQIEGSFPYFEAEERVVSRSKDECIVANVDQWLLDYSHPDWKNFTKEHVFSDNFEAYADNTKKCFEDAADKLEKWGFSRTFGLGTKVPWDERYVIEPISDASLHMAYHTVAHLVQGGVMDGSTPGPLGAKPEDFNDDVWSYVFLDTEYPKDCAIPQEKLDLLKNEFNYWYPLDLKCSGKDLISNHLITILYTHAAIWEKQEMMPRSMFCNGFMLINDEQMAKSSGNFMTVIDACKKYSSSATRMALADSGDTLEDGNFREKVANDSIEMQYKLGNWISEEISKINLEGIDWENYGYNFDEYDNFFDNEINRIIDETYEKYEKMEYKDALQLSFFDLQKLKDEYSSLKKGELNDYLVMRFIEVQLLLILPVIPHFCEHYYQKELRPALLRTQNHKEYPKLIVNARWPKKTSEYDQSMTKVFNFVKFCTTEFGLMKDKISDFVESQDLQNTTSSDDESEIYEGLIQYYAKKYSEERLKVGRRNLKANCNEPSSSPRQGESKSNNTRDGEIVSVLNSKNEDGSIFDSPNTKKGFFRRYIILQNTNNLSS